jgi:signal transduction histidine kinase
MHRIIAAHGALQESRASLQALNDGLEQRTAALVATRDELRHTNANLEAIVEARVGDLRIANEEIQRFAYIVSHDLRAPLVNVLGFTSELDAAQGDLEAFLDDVERVAPQLVTPDRHAAILQDLPEALGFIRASTAKMDRLINAILKLSREGRRKLTPEDIDVAALVEAQSASLAQQLEARDATIAIDGDSPALASDRLAIEQVFGNLIENAVKYLSPARPGRIVVSGAKDGRMLRYTIADNGRGIDERDFERIFELFRRSGEQDTSGEGIGLAYVRNLARRLGGDVAVTSVLGEGSTFTVVLPETLRAQARAAA